MPIRHRPLIQIASFGMGVALLEAGGSALHWYVLRDIPQELMDQGLTISWMLSRDFLIAFLASAAFAISATLARRSRRLHGRPLRFVGAGVASAVAIEALNWIIPGALFSPQGIVVGIVAWAWLLLVAWCAMRCCTLHAQTPADPVQGMR